MLPYPVKAGPSLRLLCALPSSMISPKNSAVASATIKVPTQPVHWMLCSALPPPLPPLAVRQQRHFATIEAGDVIGAAEYVDFDSQPASGGPLADSTAT